MSDWRWLRGLFASGFLLSGLGCASFGPVPVGPEDIPELSELAAREPNNGEAQLRLSAALAAAGRCEEAVETAEKGRAAAPRDPVGSLVIGQCLEEAGDYEGALNLYAGFIQEHGDAPGAAAVEGRRTLALQLHARQSARSAVDREGSLGPADPQTVGVLPFIVAGDSAYHALSVGLAHMLTTDLALLRRFPLVERVQINALLEELEIPSELIDPATAVRTGRLTGASRMVLGTVNVSPSGRGMTLGGTIVLESGELVDPLSLEGDLEELLDLEKGYALRVAEDLGYQLSEAERQRILENRPGSLAAFLAFANGLFAEERGDFALAADHYREAVRADPGFGEARDRLEGAVGAEAFTGSGPGETAALVSRVAQTLSSPLGPDLFGSTLQSSVLDIASHQPERATIDAGTASASVTVLPEESEIIPSLEAIIRILIRISG